MRKLGMLVFVISALGALPAAAGGRAPIEESYQATALPYPNGSYDNGEGCFYGVDGVHKHFHEFEAPRKGKFEVGIPQLTGDWDLFVTDPEGNVLAESSGDRGVPEHTELKLKKAQQISIVTCNWAGEPQVTVEYSFR
ncbi:MAG: hypothetical protein ACRDLB_12030 [Actinomycetota bacterium]